jgi:serine phosphatase RsbU (regulator of sigma subunit)
MPSGNIGVVVADVSGHGFGPALVMSQTRAFLHALLPLGLDVSELATRLNNFLITDGPDARFVTLFLAQLDPHDGRFTYASAGHECYLLGPGNQVQVLDSTSMPLGIVPGRVPTARPLVLEHGQLVLFLTDGVTETLSPQENPFGIECTLDVVRANRHRPAADIVEVLYRSARDYAHNAPQQDDITAVVLKVEAPPGPSTFGGAGI